MQFHITAPLFAIIAIGYAAVRFNVVPKAMVPGIGRFVLYIALPALIFRALMNAPINEVINISFMTAYAGGALTTFILALIIFKAIMDKPLTASGVGALGSSFSNVIFIGFPVAVQVFGSVPAAAFTMALLIDNFFMLPLSLIVMEAGTGKASATNMVGTLRKIAASLIKNPLIIAIIAGLCFSALDWQLPKTAVRVIDMLADSSGGVGLFYAGGVLVGATLKGRLPTMATVTLLKLMVCPVVVAILVSVLPPMDRELGIAVVIFASAPMFAIYPVIASKYGMEQECASTLLAATGVSFVTMSVGLMLVL